MGKVNSLKHLQKHCYYQKHGFGVIIDTARASSWSSFLERPCNEFGDCVYCVCCAEGCVTNRVNWRNWLRVLMSCWYPSCAYRAKFVALAGGKKLLALPRDRHCCCCCWFVDCVEFLRCWEPISHTFMIAHFLIISIICHNTCNETLKSDKF